MTAQLTGKSEHLRAARHYTAVGPRPGVNIFVDVEIYREAGTKTAGVAHKRLLAGVDAKRINDTPIACMRNFFIADEHGG